MQNAFTYTYFRIEIFPDIVNTFGNFLNKKEKNKDNISLYQLNSAIVAAVCHMTSVQHA